MAKGIEQRAETLGQTQRQLHDRHAVMMNSTLDLAGQQGQKVSAQIAADIRNKSTDIGESQGHGIRNTGANIDRGLDSAAENLKRVRTNALDAMTNPRSAEGKAAHLNGPSIADMGHPHHSLYVQAHSKLDGMWMTTGFRSRQELDNTAGALAAAAAKDGLDRIDHVLISKDGKRFFAVEGGATDPAHHRADVDMQQAQQQTLDQSTKQANQALQSAGPQEPPPSHGMRR